MDSNERLSTDEILSQFSDPNLASHAYLDVHFQKYNQMTQLQELHSQSSQLLSQLDHATEDLTWQLEDIMTDLKKSGPRLSYQIELLKSGVAGLVSDIEEIASPKIEEIKRRRDAEVNEDKHDSESKSNKKDIITAATIPGGQAVSSNPTIARLQQLETVRSRMKQVESVLQKAQTFDEIELTNSIVSSIENGDLEGALTTVGEAAELIQVWKGTSVYNGRAKFVAQLRKRLRLHLDNKMLKKVKVWGADQALRLARYLNLNDLANGIGAQILLITAIRQPLHGQKLQIAIQRHKMRDTTVFLVSYLERLVTKVL